MKKIVSAAAVAICLAACNQAKTDDIQIVEAPIAPVFVQENVPAEGFDVSAYSDGIQHIGIPTTDIQTSIDFYKGLGFTLATRHDIDGRDFAFVQLGTCMLELIPTEAPAMINGAVDHFCLDVKNIDEVYAKIKEAGYNVIDENINDIAFWEKGARYFFILGPNNERIEFCEVL